jgi:hypothetical protein
VIERPAFDGLGWRPRGFPKLLMKEVSPMKSKFLAVGAALLLGSLPRAYGVPSFARQTGLACSSCHTTPPELTPLGRLFKLNGYTMGGIKEITSPGGQAEAKLSLLQWLPLSAFFQISNTSTNQPQPGTQNGSFELPQAASLFLAGAMATHVGAFIQVTYSGQDDHFSWDNTDIRYSNQKTLGGKNVVYGLTFNNNPTVEDLWNDTPAWGFPWVGPDSAPSPMAGAIVDGGLAQDVAGLGAYAMWNDHLYGALTGYRSEHLGGPQPNPGVGFGVNIQGIAPYWRLAWQQTMGNNYLEVGGFGMHVASTPNAVVGPTDDYTDTAADFQLEHTLPLKKRNDLISLHGVFIHESSDLNATFAAGGAALVPHHLNTERLDGTYHIGNKYAATLGWFNTTGNTDSLLYAQSAVSGSANGNPRSDGLVSQLSYWPVQNIQLALQYKNFFQFNGAHTNYDGAGRNASGNNALYLMVWFIF